MHQFTHHSLFEIFEILKKDLQKLNAHEIIEFEVLNPDTFDSTYSGEEVKIEDVSYIYRSLKAYTDLSELLFCKMLCPIPKNKKTIVIRFKKLLKEESFHLESTSTEKYGTASHFAKIQKNEEPAFLSTYVQALRNIKLYEQTRILNLGVNNGDEFEVICKILKENTNIELVGIDYSQSAINQAKERFKQFENIHFYQHDINTLEELNLGQFDAIITIGTLQSSTINFKETFMKLVQNYLKKDGAMILGFPNCRWIDGEMIYGAKAKNYRFSELSVMIKDVYFCKKYLQQKKFRVTVTGKNYLFLTATAI